MGHAQILAKTNRSRGILEAFPDRVRHLHVHDNRGGQTPGDDLHLPIGEGAIDFLPLFGKLREIEYSGTMTLELRPEEIARCLGTLKGLLGRAGLTVREGGECLSDTVF
jgi:sugar phosphate isomerase/epimerase